MAENPDAHVTSDAEPGENCAVTREWSGSVCVGIITERWPYGKLRVNSDRITVETHMRNFLLPKDRVNSVKKAGFFPWLGGGIRFEHSTKGIPELAFSPVLFWQRGRILEHLAELGYRVC